MFRNRLTLMLLFAGALGLLVWWDNRPPTKPLPSQRIQAKDLANGQPSVQLSEKSRGATAVIAASSQRPPGNPLASLDKETLRDMVERPLFAPSRRRPPPPPEAALGKSVEVVSAPVAAVAHANYALLGIIRDGERAIALLRNTDDGRNFRGEVGDVVEGWRIAAIGHLSVSLQRPDGEAQEVHLAEK
jgi:hypothetical protein